MFTVYQDIFFSFCSSFQRLITLFFTVSRLAHRVYCIDGIKAVTLQPGNMVQNLFDNSRREKKKKKKQISKCPCISLKFSISRCHCCQTHVERTATDVICRKPTFLLLTSGEKRWSADECDPNKSQDIPFEFAFCVY